jgi:hypothetical protein
MVEGLEVALGRDGRAQWPAAGEPPLMGAIDPVGALELPVPGCEAVEVLVLDAPPVVVGVLGVALAAGVGAVPDPGDPTGVLEEASPEDGVADGSPVWLPAVWPKGGFTPSAACAAADSAPLAIAAAVAAARAERMTCVAGPWLAAGADATGARAGVAGGAERAGGAPDEAAVACGFGF